MIMRIDEAGDYGSSFEVDAPDVASWRANVVAHGSKPAVLD